MAFLLLFACTALPQNNHSETEIRQALNQFIQAFDNLDWDRFTASFAEDATMFQPRNFPRRAGNKAEIEAQFKQVFKIIRGAQVKPPYMDLQPRDLRIQVLTPDVAIATFHLDDRPGLLNRRTIVLQRFKDEWRIVHIHASELPLTATQ